MARGAFAKGSLPEATAQIADTPEERDAAWWAKYHADRAKTVRAIELIQTMRRRALASVNQGELPEDVRLREVAWRQILLGIDTRIERELAARGLTWADCDFR